jgi:thiol-disulfide isomerase/thioredoxin
MTRRRFVGFLAVGVLLSIGTPNWSGAADEPRKQAPEFPGLAKLNAAHEEKVQELERRRIADLTALAARADKAEADAAYAQLLHLAIVRNLYTEAQPAVDRCLATETAAREVRSLATLVRIIERADKGEFDPALTEWKAFLEALPEGKPTPDDEAMTVAVGEAFLRRLNRAGRHDIAMKLCEVCCEHEGPSKTIKDHFDARMDRLASIGKPAPALKGTDVDGAKVDLASHKGKVVLVEFWATWCPPCVASIPHLNSLVEKYGDRGFEIVGVNVDAMHEDVKDVAKALPVVRRFLLKHSVRWTNVRTTEGAEDIATAWGVEEIPANFLIGRDGKLVAVELTDADLEKAVARALGESKSDKTGK